MAEEDSGIRRRRAGAGDGQPSSDNGGQRPTVSDSSDTSASTTVTTPTTSAPHSQPAENQPGTQPPNVPTRMGGREAIRQALLRMVMMYAMYHFYIKPKKAARKGSNVTTETNTSGRTNTASTSEKDIFNRELRGNWNKDVDIEVRMWISTSSVMSIPHACSQLSNGVDSHWHVDDLKFSPEAQFHRTENLTLGVPTSVRSENGTWFAHVFVTKRLANIWKCQGTASMDDILYARHEMVKWIEINSKTKKKHLLGDGDSSDADLEQSGDGSKMEQVWKPSLWIVLVAADNKIVVSHLPHGSNGHFRLSSSQTMYLPPMHVDEFWQLRSDLQPMNETVSEVRVECSFTTMGLFKWAMYRQFDKTWEKQQQIGTMGMSEVDEMKRMFLETNFWLLCLTTVVSLAHSVLEMLAFKHDIAHWNKMKSFEGVSVRSLVLKIVMEVIVFLYLLDDERTSWMIKIGNGIGIVIELWKFGKAVDVRLQRPFPWIRMAHRESYSAKTKEYDEQAMRYLSYVMYPIIVCYAAYSLLYNEHKSWYSWVINSLVGAVYGFGFIMMFPQIFINYKLKSVAHLPVNALCFKFLNTIIDDLFSFIIRMPPLHRLACFRDDIVFIIFLYQRWIYPVDKSRVNEFGQSFQPSSQSESTESTTSTKTTTTTTKTTAATATAKKED